MAAANSDSVAPARSAAGRSIIVREHDPRPTTPPLKINPAAKVRAQIGAQFALGRDVARCKTNARRCHHNHQCLLHELDDRFHETDHMAAVPPVLPSLHPTVTSATFGLGRPMIRTMEASD
jgi:hypothetical protein